MTILSDLIKINEFLGNLQSNKKLVEDSVRLNLEELQKLQESHSEVVKQMSLDLKSVEVVQVLFDKVSDSGFRFLEQLLDQALLYVFPNRDFSIKIHVGLRGAEKTVEFYLHDGVCENPLSECSGAVQTVVSITLQVYYIIKNELRRFIVFDEKFGALDSAGFDPVMSYLKTLEKDLGFTILFVTHNYAFKESELVTKVYEMYRGNITLVKG